MSARRLPDHPLCQQIVSELARAGSLSFADLGRAIDAPYVLLNAATLLLKDGGWIASEVSLVGKGLRMEYRLTWEGRAALAAGAATATVASRSANVA